MTSISEKHDFIYVLCVWVCDTHDTRHDTRIQDTRPYDTRTYDTRTRVASTRIWTHDSPNIPRTIF